MLVSVKIVSCTLQAALTRVAHIFVRSLNTNSHHRTGREIGVNA